MVGFFGSKQSTDGPARKGSGVITSVGQAPIVDKSSPVPAYHQLARALRSRIERGEWQPGDRLPTELELSHEYRLSRATVRQALSDLAREAFVSREQGKGTFARKSPSPLLHDLGLPLGLGHRSRSQGFQLDSRVLRLELTTEVPASILEQLGLESGSPTVIYLERVLTINGVPSAISKSWLSDDLVPGFVTHGLVDGSLSVTLRDRYDLLPARYDNFLEVRGADYAQAGLLFVEIDAPLILLSATSYSAADGPLEASLTWWRSDRVRFRFGVETADPVVEPTLD